MDRRRFVLAATGLAACGPDLAKPFNGIAYIACQRERAVSIVNLSRFKLSKELPLDAEPAAVLVSRSRRVWVLTPSNGTITEIEGATGVVQRKHRLAGSAISMRLAPNGQSIWLAAREPQALIQLDRGAQRVLKTIKLAKPVVDFDLSPVAALAAVGSPPSLIDLATGRRRDLGIDGDASLIRFRPDGKEVLAAHAPARLISIADVETGRLLVKLPLPLEPERFCFTLDKGGQMFVTGRGMDAVAIVSPYQTSVDETILAGRAPGSMAVDLNYLYLTNPETGDLAVISIADRSLLAKIPVGQEPVQVMITPDGQYCLVLNRKSSDLAVIRISKLGGYQRYKAAPLFTMVALGASPVSGAICSL